VSSPEADSEELLSTARPLLPRAVRRAAVLLAAAVVAVGIAVYATHDSSHRAPVALPTSSAPQATPPERPATRTRPWPSARSACHGRTDLPLVRGTVPVRA
jgi:hypothetical protein